MVRPYNFAAGPATLPEPVLNQVRDELLDYQGSGMSVMEMSHRSAQFEGIATDAESRLRRLLAIPDDFAVLFLQGGATGQFAAVPLNLAPQGAIADYVITGHWSQKSATEAGKFVQVNVAADSGPGHHSIPDRGSWRLSADAAYVSFAGNETIGGVEFPEPPDVGDAVMVGDLSSTLLSRPTDVTRFGVIYAGMQKNLGPAGLTVVVVRRDLLGRSGRALPAIMDWADNASSGSMLNTPPTFVWYVAGLVFAWVEEQGGVAALGERNRRKAALLYQAIDDSELYANPVTPAHRSWMNVPFTLADAALDPVFLREAADRGLLNLKGHRSIGGMRASLYNAMPEAGVTALIDFMHDFERRHG
jgi:phosphoserine aminotransferase